MKSTNIRASRGNAGMTAFLAGAAALLAAAPADAAVTISTAATSNMSCASGVCTPTSHVAVLNAAELQNLLASGNVKVTTGAGHLASVTKNIVLDAPLGWASAHGLTLDAYQSITIDKPVADNGAGALTLTTNDGGSGGALSFGPKGDVTFLGVSNSLTINGKSYTLVNSVASLATAIAGNASGNYALANS